MSLSSGKLRVLIATTNGPVEVQLLTEEDPVIGRSVACIGGTTETAGIAGAYHAFVARPTGIIEGRFGHSCFRLDLSGRIDTGSSWQLGVLIAHGLLANGRLAQEKDLADGIVWATGSVRPVDLTVGGVSHVPEKLANSMNRLSEEIAAHRAVLLAIPAANKAEVKPAVLSQLSALGISFVALDHAQAAFDALALQLPSGPSKGKPLSVPVPPPPPPAVSAKVAQPSGRRYVWAIPLSAALCILVAIAVTFLLRQSNLASVSTQPAQVAAPVEVAEHVKIDPDRIPFIVNKDKDRVRNEYMAAPNYKALASSLLKMAFVTGQATQEAADNGAMEACEKANIPAETSILLISERICDLYASGNVVVTHRSIPALPPMPWTHASVARPFDVSLMPMINLKKKAPPKAYPTWQKSKAIVLAPNGTWYASYRQNSADEAIRRSLERCGYLSSAPCMVVGVEDNFVVAVPTLAQAVGFYRSEALSNIGPNEREEVARRLSNTTEGWNAVATGAAGHTGIAYGVVSEQKAVDDALAACANRDTNCRIAVIGPFLVDPLPPSTKAEKGPLVDPPPGPVQTAPPPVAPPSNAVPKTPPVAVPPPNAARSMPPFAGHEIVKD